MHLLLKISYTFLRDDIKSYLVKALIRHGWTVEAIATPNGLYVLQPARDILEQEASQYQIKKKVVGQSEPQVFDYRCRMIYEEIDSDDFLSPYEESFIMNTFVERIMPEDGFFELMKRAGYRGTRETFASECLPVITWLQRFSLIDYLTPVHQEKHKEQVWTKNRWRLRHDINSIRHYFGEQVSMYHAWMEHLTKWYWVPAVLGACTYASYFIFGHSVDTSPIASLYSLCVVLWAGITVKSWARQCNKYAVEWDVYDRPKYSDLVRPEFKGDLVTSRITGRVERYYAPHKRLTNYCLSTAITVIFLIVSYILMICSLNLQGFVRESHSWSYIKLLSQYAQEGAIFGPNGKIPFMDMVPILIHVLVIRSFNTFAYSKVALWLTEKENHRTQAGYSNSIVVKRFIFESFDAYIPIAYAAFVEASVTHTRSLLKGMFIAACARRLFTETIAPYMMYKLYQIGDRAWIQRNKQAYGERPSSLEGLKDSWKPKYDVFDDYLEMMIQFGYVTMFAAAFPLAATLALPYTFIEAKSDLFKLCRVYQRPRVVRVSNIGSWGAVYRVQAWASVITNIALFAYASNQFVTFFPDLFDKSDDEVVMLKSDKGPQAVLVVLLLENVLLLLLLLLTYAIPDMSHDTFIEVERQRYVRHQSHLKQAAQSRSMMMRSFQEQGKKLGSESSSKEATSK